MLAQFPAWLGYIVLTSWAGLTGHPCPGETTCFLTEFLTSGLRNEFAKAHEAKQN